jgi:hypothetical protein
MVRPLEPDNAWKNLGGGDGMQVQVDTRDNKTELNLFYRTNFLSR